MKDIKGLLEQLKQYFYTKPYIGLEGEESSPSLNWMEWTAYLGILKTLSQEELMEASEIIDKGKYPSVFSYAIQKAQEQRQESVAKKNESIEVILSRFLNKKSKRVMESRKELIERFEYQSYSLQKRIVRAFLSSNTTSDIEWGAEEANKRWDKSYVEYVKNAFDRKDSDVLARVIIKHMPLDYVRSMESRLVMHNRSEFCIRLADQADLLIKKYDLNIFEELYIKARTGQKLQMDDQEVERRFFRFIFTFAEKSLLEVYRGRKDDSIMNIPCIRRTLQALGVLGYRGILMQFLRMNQSAVSEHLEDSSRGEYYYAQKWMIENYFPSARATEEIETKLVRDAVDRFIAPQYIKIGSIEDLDEYDDLPPDIIDSISDFI